MRRPLSSPGFTGDGDLDQEGSGGLRRLGASRGTELERHAEKDGLELLVQFMRNGDVWEIVN